MSGGKKGVSSINAIMVNMEHAEIPVEDRRIVIPDAVYLALEDMAADERKRVSNPLIKEMITPKSLAQKILAVAVKRGAA